jgi:tRNA-specific 2-thiouridylase
VNFVKDYWNNVFDVSLQGFARGASPNPDTLCNKEIKFHAFLEFAKQHRADFVATGHYAQVVRTDSDHEHSRLLSADDREHDQSYFLSTLRLGALDSVLFPLGHLQKSQVRSIAKSQGIEVADKPSSRGICFIGKRDFAKFLSNYIEGIAGDVVTLDGKRIGTHSGISCFAVGQRARLPGKTERWFVVDKNAAKNEVIVVDGSTHPALFSDSWTLHNISWISRSPNLPVSGLPIAFRTRYQQPLSLGQLVVNNSGASATYRVTSRSPIRGVTPGQTLAMYDLQGSECLGGGIIAAVDRTMFHGRPLLLQL